ncbi:hypothetical protein TSAR_014912 [Trichomalopsis sarcophagae]|uniref:Uncharacterized protein n=1 Tax=Trichomalopsis sarcophagae TaxID=543379 RepID=A0A232F8F7_9HYME|nr:hypothetical protein TSAR_014912 [Trichomalopsis sarcophagae]
MKGQTMDSWTKVRTFPSMLSIWMTNSIANSGDDILAIFSVVCHYRLQKKKCKIKLLIPNFFHGLRGPRSSVILVCGFEGFSEVLKCVKEMRDGRASSFTIWESVIVTISNNKSETEKMSFLCLDYGRKKALLHLKFC